jgi:hypothetical protein
MADNSHAMAVPDERYPNMERAFMGKFRLFERDNVNVHRAAANILQAEKAARPAAPCATYCYAAMFAAD